MKKGRVQVFAAPSPILSVVQGQTVATLAEGKVVRVLEERDGLSFVVHRWPDWSDANYTFQIQGWVDTKALREPTASENP